MMMVLTMGFMINMVLRFSFISKMTDHDGGQLEFFSKSKKNMNAMCLIIDDVDFPEQPKKRFPSVEPLRNRFCIRLTLGQKQVGPMVSWGFNIPNIDLFDLFDMYFIHFHLLKSYRAHC